MVCMEKIQFPALMRYYIGGGIKNMLGRYLGSLDFGDWHNQFLPSVLP